MALLSLSRFPTTLRKLLRPVENARRYGDAEPFDFEWETRSDQYAQNKAMLDNTIYDLQAEGGFREAILERLFGVTQVDSQGVRLAGNYNPTRNIVDAYQNVFRGNWGQEIKVADTVDEKPVNPALVTDDSPLRRIWRWSNLDTQKQILQEWAANLGTVGIRIVAVADPDPLKRRVTLQFDHPGTIIDFDEDDRGNVTQVLLRYKALRGPLGERRYDVDVEELITKEEFVQTIAGNETMRSPNGLGVCPYVILRHRDDGHEFGKWAYAGTEDLIHQINWLISNQGESIVEHGWPTWFATAGGNAPQTFEFGRKKVAYVKTDPNTPPPSLEPLVAPLNQADARAYWERLLNMLVDRQPEMVVSNIESLSGQSGETIAKLLIPAEMAIERAKSQYEHAIKRAMQIGLSEGIRIGLWDLGTGRGTAEAADRAYQQGMEDFDFVPRRPLPETVYDKIQSVTAENAQASAKLNLMSKAESVTNLSGKEVLRQGGFDKAAIAKIRKEKAQEDATAASSDGVDTVGGNGQNP
jgi:hypothetical protein